MIVHIMPNFFDIRNQGHIEVCEKKDYCSELVVCDLSYKVKTLVCFIKILLQNIFLNKLFPKYLIY